MDNPGWVLGDDELGFLPRESDFLFRQFPLESPQPGQMLTRTIFLSLDPYQWMYKRTGREGPGDLCHGRTLSQVIESRIDAFSPGDFVFNTNGWIEYAMTGEGIPRPYYMGPRKVDPALGPLSYSLGVLGMPGLTAYAGIILQCAPRPGETLVISAASGGVGQIAGQLGKLLGCRVVGIAGSPEKCAHLTTELGFDDGVDYRSESFTDDLAQACPNGVDCYFENVGGAIFDAVVRNLNDGARISICGVIAQYSERKNEDAKEELKRRGKKILDERGVETFDLMVGKFVETHERQFLTEMSDWIKSGKIRYREDIRQGLSGAPCAFIDLMNGGGFGKVLVQVSSNPLA